MSECESERVKKKLKKRLILPLNLENLNLNNNSQTNLFIKYSHKVFILPITECWQTLKKMHSLFLYGGKFGPINQLQGCSQ